MEPASDVPLTTRTERTIDKTRQGGLPASGDGKTWVAPGSLKECSGCGDVIAREEQGFEVEVAGLLFRFHSECHEVWVIFGSRDGGARFA